MKLILSIMLMAIAVSKPTGYLKWETNFDHAKKESKTLNKKILLKFSGSDWCANCKRLDKQLFQSSNFTQFAQKNLVLLEADFPARKKNKLSKEQTKHNEKLAELYNKKGVFPLVLILDSNGKVLGQLQQPKKTNEEYINQFKKLIQ